MEKLITLFCQLFRCIFSFVMKMVPMIHQLSPVPKEPVLSSYTKSTTSLSSNTSKPNDEVRCTSLANSGLSITKIQHSNGCIKSNVDQSDSDSASESQSASDELRLKLRKRRTSMKRLLEKEQLAKHWLVNNVAVKYWLYGARWLDQALFLLIWCLNGYWK